MRRVGRGAAASATVLVSALDEQGAATEPERRLDPASLVQYVREREAGSPRWVWDDTAVAYPPLLAAGVRVRRCHDLRLSHAILRNSTLTAASELALAESDVWDSAVPEPALVQQPPQADALFDFDGFFDAPCADEPFPVGDDDAGREFRRQLEAVAGSAEPGRIRLLLAAESAGALVAAEMRFAGLPWRSEIHEALLTAELGPRVAHGVRPQRLEQLAGEIRDLLGNQTVNPDSPQEMLKALQGAGLQVASTQSWVLQEIEHPVIAPLLRYKKLSRLLTANGWSWLDSWIVNGRFHAEYLPGGVVTGRWAARGGGALQLPKQVRGAVVADAGWTFVVADAAQLEPRILAALANDMAMARAGTGTDLYAGIVASGVVETRAHAKVAMLGAMYGATTGESGRLLPRLAAAYPRALGLVETAARRGERGDVVTTRLGRSSPRPPVAWLDAQAHAYEPDATAVDERRARAQARDWGRFTRNFVVQGSAAEWALCWMADIRLQLWPEAGETAGVVTQSAHLVFFLHDEVIVHTPLAHAEHVAAVITRSAQTAGRLLFGDFPVDFPLTVAIVDSYADAK